MRRQKVLLVTTSDITKRLETEQQLIQASKMATLGEMATGVAHELNQPLSVIKTVSSFFMKKLDAAETIATDILSTMLTKVDSNVDRAASIINHMRQFARKSDMEMVSIQLNEVLKSAFRDFQPAAQGPGNPGGLGDPGGAAAHPGRSQPAGAGVHQPAAQCP
jgi:histidine kinase